MRSEITFFCWAMFFPCPAFGEMLAWNFVCYGVCWSLWRTRKMSSPVFSVEHWLTHGCTLVTAITPDICVLFYDLFVCLVFWDLFVCFSGMYLHTFPGHVCVLFRDMFACFSGRYLHTLPGHVSMLLQEVFAYSSRTCLCDFWDVLSGMHACVLFTDRHVRLLFWDTCVCFSQTDMCICFSGTPLYAFHGQTCSSCSSAFLGHLCVLSWELSRGIFCRHGGVFFWCTFISAFLRQFSTDVWMLNTMFTYGFQRMQEEMDGMALELQRREASIAIITAEKERLLEQLRDLTGESQKPVGCSSSSPWF